MSTTSTISTHIKRSNSTSNSTSNQESNIEWMTSCKKIANFLNVPDNFKKQLIMDKIINHVIVCYNMLNSEEIKYIKLYIPNLINYFNKYEYPESYYHNTKIKTIKDYCYDAVSKTFWELYH